MVTNFTAEQRSLTKYCNSRTSLDETLRYRIQCDSQDEGIQRTSHKSPKERQLILTMATEIAVTMETAARYASNLQIALGTELNISQSNKSSVNLLKSPNSWLLRQNEEKCN